MVLEGLSAASFEPIEYVSEKIAITSLKRIGNLLVAPLCLEFALGTVKAFLHPKLGYVPGTTYFVAGLLSSKAILTGASLQDVFDEPVWSSPHTFVRFYNLDLCSTPGSQVLFSCACYDFTQDRHLLVQRSGY